MTAHAVVIGTAGHVDHGKTSLVHALTGIDTDRLPIEKARGITTELGFAQLALEGHTMAMVDVPGHERFVRAMVAGVTGVDVVLLVIAADEGVMPQTREHLDICELLGVRRGVVALTKADAVTLADLTARQHEIRARLQGTFLEGAAIVPVSARHGDGLAALRSELAALVAATPVRATDVPFRMPIDRVFSLRGFGTLITGTISDGVVRVGDELELLPSRKRARVRGLGIFGQVVDVAHAGMRAAINVVGVSVDEVSRGDVAAAARMWQPQTTLDVRYRHLALAPAIGKNAAVLLHHGTTQVAARLISAHGIAPGATTWAQLRLDKKAPVLARVGDRFLVRGFGLLPDYGTTIGGGEIVRIGHGKWRASDATYEATLQAFAQSELPARVTSLVTSSRGTGRTWAELCQRTGQGATAVRATLANLVGGGHIAESSDGRYGAETARTQPDATNPVARAAAASASAGGAMVSSLVESVHERAVREAYVRWGKEPPKPLDVATELRFVAADVQKAHQALLARGDLVRIASDYYVAAVVLAPLKAALIAHLQAHKTITTQEWKALAGVSRKYAIPLAEYFDAAKVTLRVGDIRRLR